MKHSLYACALVAIAFSSCKKNNPSVSKAYVDSLLDHYTTPAMAKQNAAEVLFWKNRIDPKRPGQVSESRYAAALFGRFHFTGDIANVKLGEDVLRGVNKTYNNTQAGPFAALTTAAMLTHHFSDADTLLHKAVKIGVDKFTQNTLSFDVSFELGHYDVANLFLSRLRPAKDYSYYFRLSKMDHLKANLDSAISHMQKAADLEPNEPYLRDIALSNTADLYIHAGNLPRAAEIYEQCLKLNGADFHSLLGLGWVALVHDKNDTLAERLFKFVSTQNKLPDAYFKLYQMAQQRGDKVLEKTYANEFAAKATDTAYGRMYNKYLIELYIGVLNAPAKAEALAADELNNRKTPQTYAWYAYALFENHKKDAAYKVFRQYVSGQPLEGLELFYMAQLMKGLDKGYDAGEFFKAAETNQYDLSPDMQKNLKAALEE